MADRQTGSVWTHFDDSVLTGPLAGQGLQLEVRPIWHTTWSEWVELHPDTLVLDWYAEFADLYNERVRPGRGGLGPRFQETVLNWDERLPENALVVGVNIGADFRAYPLDSFPDGLNAVNDELHGYPIVVMIDPSKSFGLAFLASAAGQTLSFSVQDGLLVDEQGGAWDLNGRAVSGPLAGTQLTFVTSFVTEWYGWSAYHPDTEIYGLE